jgi:hypothetical protein
MPGKLEIKALVQPPFGSMKYAVMLVREKSIIYLAPSA